MADNVEPFVTKKISDYVTISVEVPKEIVEKLSDYDKERLTREIETELKYSFNEIRHKVWQASNHYFPAGVAVAFSDGKLRVFT